MKNLALLTVLLSLFVFTGCEDNNRQEYETKNKPHISQALKEKITKPSTATQVKKRDLTTAESLGISVDDGKIIIDTKQTIDFFHSIGQKLKKGMNNIKEDLKKKEASSSSETGIVVTKTSMHIDLNKTKNFMEKWIKSMESVVQEVNRTMSDIEKSLPKD